MDSGFGSAIIAFEADKLVPFPETNERGNEHDLKWNFHHLNPSSLNFGNSSITPKLNPSLKSVCLSDSGQWTMIQSSLGRFRSAEQEFGS